MTALRTGFVLALLAGGLNGCGDDGKSDMPPPGQAAPAPQPPGSTDMKTQMKPTSAAPSPTGKTP